MNVVEASESARKAADHVAGFTIKAAAQCSRASAIRTPPKVASVVAPQICQRLNRAKKMTPAAPDVIMAPTAVMTFRFAGMDSDDPNRATNFTISRKNGLYMLWLKSPEPTAEAAQPAAVAGPRPGARVKR